MQNLAVLPRDIASAIFREFTNTHTTEAQLAAFAHVNTGFNAHAQPLLAHMKVQLTARAVTFQHNIQTLSHLHYDQQIVDGLNEFIVIRQLHEGMLRQLLPCRVRVLTRDGIGEIILRFMRENPESLAIQVMCCQILNRKNEHVPAGAFCVGEPAMVCRALFLFGDNILLAKPAMQHLAKAADRNFRADEEDPTLQNTSVNIRPFREAFCFFDGKLANLVRHVLACIRTYNTPVVSAENSQVVLAGCRFVQLMLIPRVLAATSMITGIDNVMLSVCVNNQAHENEVVSPAHQGMLKMIGRKASEILASLVEVDAMSASSNIAQIFSPRVVGGDLKILSILTKYCSNTRRQAELRDCEGLVLFLQSVLDQPCERAALKNMIPSLLFLEVFSRGNADNQQELISLGILHTFSRLMEERDRTPIDTYLFYVKEHIILVLKNFFFQPMSPQLEVGMMQSLTAANAHGKTILDFLVALLKNFAASEFMVLPSLTILTWMFAKNSFPDLEMHIGLMKGAVRYLHEYAEMPGLQASAFSLMCNLQLACQPELVVNEAILKAVQSVQENASDWSILDPCIRFFFTLSANPTTVNMVRSQIVNQCLMQLLQLPVPDNATYIRYMIQDTLHNMHQPLAAQ